MRIIHWRRLRLNTGKLPRSERPSAVTSSLASTVPRPGHQLTGASRQVGQAVLVEDGALLGHAELGPGASVRRRARARGELGDQLRDRPGPTEAAVGAWRRASYQESKMLQEDPLGPAVELDVGGGDRPPGVVGQAETTQLAAHVGDVRLGGDPRVLRRSARRTARPAGRRRRSPSRAARCRRSSGGSGRRRRWRCSRAGAPRAAPPRTGRGTCRARRACRDRPRPAARTGPGRVGRLEGALGLPAVLPPLLDLGSHGGVVPVLGVHRSCGAHAPKGRSSAP